MNLEVKLGDKQVSMPMEFSYNQWIRLRDYGDNIPPHKMIAACSGLDENEIKKADLEQVEYISSVLARFYFSGTNPNEVMVTFKHNGIEYGLLQDFSRLKYGAWVDLEVYSSQDIDLNIPKILSLLYYPIKRWKGKKYILEEYSDELVSETAENFKDVPMKVWFGASSFFLLFVSKYMDATKNSLSMKLKMMKWYRMGIRRLPNFLKRRLPDDSIFNALKF